MNSGTKISIERKNKGFSQEMLAENSGVSLRTIQRIENSSSKPRPYTLKVIADALNMDIADLVEVQNVSSKSITENNSLGKVNLMNSSALLGLIIPLFNIIVPGIIWKLHNKNQFVREKGKRIMSFQILWFLFSLFLLFVTHILHYKITGEFITGRLPVVVIVYGLLLLVNGFFIMKASIQMGKGKTEIYPFVPNLF